jgi:hypothetical protein
MTNFIKYLLLSLILLASGTALAQGIVLPPDSVAKPPPESASVIARALSGKWQGMWDGKMPHVLVIEEVKSNTELQILYAWQDPLTDNSWGAGWYRTTATIDGNTLKVQLRNGNRAWYELMPDGSLKAGYQRGGSFGQSNANLNKVIQ